MVGVAARSVTGFADNNQDACTVIVADTPWGPLSMATVCDGVGGLTRGELASALVVRRLAQWFSNELPEVMRSHGENFSVQELDTHLDELLQTLHAQLRSYGLSHASPLATTCTSVLTFKGAFLACQVGDARLYLMGPRGLEQITEDQTPVAQLLAAGKISEEEARSHPESHLILQAVGVGNELHPHFSTGTYAPDDLFLLCSDGVHKCLGNERIHACLAELAPEKDTFPTASCDALVERALAARTSDNATAVCLMGNPLKSPEHHTLVVGERPW